jgi:dodecin
MSVAKIIEISAASSKSFEDAIATGVAKAADSVKGGKIVEYRVQMKVTFVLKATTAKKKK